MSDFVKVLVALGALTLCPQILFSLSGSTSPGLGKDNPERNAIIERNIGSMSLAFAENRGQKDERVPFQTTSRPVGDHTTIQARVNSLTDGRIKKGEPFILEIWMYNDWFTITGVSFTWKLYSDDSSITNITHRLIDASSGDTGSVYSADDVPHVSSYNDSSILMYNGYDTLWSLIKIWTGWSWDGSLPDTVNFSGISMTGWPMDTVTTLYMGFALQIDEIGTFCIDLIKYPHDPWGLETINDHFEGPYCWSVGLPATDVREPEELPLPADFKLGQNYPNPFNANTFIEYSLPERAYVEITIYNVLGNEVRTLVNGVEDSGTHRVIWDGRNANGGSVATGIYFYRLKASEFVETKKMILLK